MEEIKVPIYLITGFLESGKTSFLSFTLQQDYFQVEGKTLLILCEEGEEEYDEEALKKSNTVVEVIDSEEELTPEQKVYFEYTCRGGDYIKTCTVPSPHLNCDDLEREKKMLIVTINEIPGKKLEALGVVRGSTVQSRNLGHDMMAGFRTLVGGEVTDYADMLTEARQIATGRMAKNAEELGADAVVGMRYASASVMQGAAEVIAYGTAVRFV